MYRHCIFCKADFGGNEVIERFPVGRRLAFDAAQGRLWVVCKRCNRWNLSPLEERWEAIEVCERIFRDTRTRLSTENIGLARVREGTDLVRIGRPQRPEFAAWRYGPGLRRRRVKSYAALGALAVGSIGIMTAPWLSGFGAVPVLWQVPNWFGTIRRATHVVVKLPAGMGQEISLKRKHVENTQVEAEKYGWVFKVPHTHGTLLLRGGDALRAAARVLPHRNNYGGSHREVAQAVAEIQRTLTADGLFTL